MIAATSVQDKAVVFPILFNMSLTLLFLNCWAKLKELTSALCLCSSSRSSSSSHRKVGRRRQRSLSDNKRSVCLVCCRRFEPRIFRLLGLARRDQLLFFYWFSAYGWGFSLYPEIFYTGTVTKRLPVCIVRDPGLEPMSSASEAWCSIKEPPHLTSGIGNSK